LNIVDVSMGVGMIKAGGREASTRPAAFRRRGTLPILETPFYFNELNECVNEKIRARQTL
jgi:hypothetical protein